MVSDRNATASIILVSFQCIQFAALSFKNGRLRFVFALAGLDNQRVNLEEQIQDLKHKMESEFSSLAEMEKEKQELTEDKERLQRELEEIRQSLDETEKERQELEVRKEIRECLILLRFNC